MVVTCKRGFEITCEGNEIKFKKEKKEALWIEYVGNDPIIYRADNKVCILNNSYMYQALSHTT